MPHGENVILVLEDGVPVSAVMKDIAEEIVVMGTGWSCPTRSASGSRRAIPDEREGPGHLHRRLRLLLPLPRRTAGGRRRAAARTSSGGPPRPCLRDYQGEHPELAEQFARHDLFAPEFALSCLNRLQLRNNQQMLDLADPSGGLQMAGRLQNPLARFA